MIDLENTIKYCHSRFDFTVPAQILWKNNKTKVKQFNQRQNRTPEPQTKLPTNITDQTCRQISLRLFYQQKLHVLKINAQWA